MLQAQECPLGCDERRFDAVERIARPDKNAVARTRAAATENLPWPESSASELQQDTNGSFDTRDMAYALWNANGNNGKTSTEEQAAQAAAGGSAAEEAIDGDGLHLRSTTTTSLPTFVAANLTVISVSATRMAKRVIWVQIIPG